MPTGRGRRAEAGYSLVALVMIVTVLNVLVAIVLPVWSQEIKREKEEELISRGFQYAEAIRVFQRRFGRLPVNIKELYEVRPRCIRQLWKDPMTENGKWSLLIQGAVPLPRTGQGPADTKNPSDSSGPFASNNPEGSDDKDNDPGSYDPLAPPGPIRGVRSRAQGEAIHILFESNRYEDWWFTVDKLTAYIGGPGSPSGIPRLSALTLGRPFRIARGALVPPGARAAPIGPLPPKPLEPPGTPPTQPPGKPPGKPGGKPSPKPAGKPPSKPPGHPSAKPPTGHPPHSGSMP